MGTLDSSQSSHSSKPVKEVKFAQPISATNERTTAYITARNERTENVQETTTNERTTTTANSPSEQHDQKTSTTKKRGPPRVTLKIAQGRDYSFLLQQTKIVYNRLLSDKYDKLLHRILTKKQSYDDTCDEMAKEHIDKALEYAVKAQAELITMQEEANKELGYLHMDYQKKLLKMNKQLEETWRNEKLQNTNVDFKVYQQAN